MTILATHRGVLFVHNLVTAITSLAIMSEQAAPFSTSKKLNFPEEFEKTQRDKLLADHRYSLLIQDLIEYSGKLDLGSIDQILSAVQRLDHCHYRLFGSLLRRVYSLELAPADLSTAISVGQALEWAGFAKAQTYFQRLSDLVAQEADKMSNRDLLNALVLFSKISSVFPSVLSVASLSLQGRIPQLPDRQLGIAAIAVSEYGNIVPAATATVDLIASAMCSRSPPLRDMIRVSVALRRCNVFHAELLAKSWRSVMSELEIHTSARERMEASVASISDIATLVESCAHFGHVTAADLREQVLPYILDNLDVVTEESAIKLLLGLAMAPEAVTAVTAPTVALLIRKIAAATDSWERHMLKIICIIFSKIMNFDFVDAEFRKLVVDASLAHWLMDRRGYGVPYPELSEPLFLAMREEFSDQKMLFNEWIPNSPFNADILLPDARVVVLVLSRFASNGGLVGVDLLQQKLIQQLGWTVVPVDRNLIRAAQLGCAGLLGEIHTVLGTSNPNPYPLA